MIAYKEIKKSRRIWNEETNLCFDFADNVQYIAAR